MSVAMTTWPEYPCLTWWIRMCHGLRWRVVQPGDASVCVRRMDAGVQVQLFCDVLNLQVGGKGRRPNGRSCHTKEPARHASDPRGTIMGLDGESVPEEGPVQRFPQFHRDDNEKLALNRGLDD